MTKRELSRDPHRIRIRLRNGTNPARDLAMLEEEAGYKPVSEWDMEELARGRPRNSRGSFSGPRPRWLTLDVQAEAMKRLREESFGDLMALLPLATGVMRKALLNDDDPKTQFAAAMWLNEQLLGKARQRVSIDAIHEMTPGEHTAQAIASAIVLDDGAPQNAMVWEGEVVEDDDEPEDDEEIEFEEVRDDEDDLRPLPARRR